MTGRPLRLHEDADLELNDAADYYDRESSGLGSIFLDEVDSGFDRIRDDAIRVLAIAHQRKRPYYWRGRR